MVIFHSYVSLPEGILKKKTDVRPEAVAKLEEAFAKLLEQHDQQLGVLRNKPGDGEGLVSIGGPVAGPKWKSKSPLKS